MEVNVNRTRSRGHIELESSSSNTPPLIHANLLGDMHDVDTLIAGAKYTLSLMQGPVLGPITENILAPTEIPGSRDEWEDWIRQNAGPCYHPVGTCKMGVDETAVVSPDLKVKGIDGLRVIDASIMPQIISGNTNAAAMMIGHKGAEMVLSDA